MTLRLLAALLPHGNKRCSESSRHLIRGCPYTATGKMHIYGNRYFLSTGAVGTCETGRVLICTSLSHVSKGLRDRHSGVRESHVMLSNVCESLRYRRRSASCSLALRYRIKCQSFAFFINFMRVFFHLIYFRGYIYNIQKLRK